MAARANHRKIYFPPETKGQLTRNLIGSIAIAAILENYIEVLLLN